MAQPPDGAGHFFEIAVARAMRRACLIALLVLLASCVKRPSWVIEPLPAPGESLDWVIHEAGNNHMIVEVGETIDIVVVRSYCRSVSYHDSGCWSDTTATASPTWRLGNGDLVSMTTIDQPRHLGRWAAAAGVRLTGLRPGKTYIDARIPEGRMSEMLQVIPRAHHVVIEPHDTVVTAGDIVRTRITARDSSGTIVAVIEWPEGWAEVVRREDTDGYTEVIFPVSWQFNTLVMQFGTHAAFMKLVFRPRPEGSE